MAVKTVVGITISLLVYVPLALSTPCPPSGCPTQDTDDVELIQKRIDVESSLQLDQGTSAATKANTTSVAASLVIQALREDFPTTGAREYLTGVLEEERNKTGGVPTSKDSHMSTQEQLEAFQLSGNAKHVHLTRVLFVADSQAGMSHLTTLIPGMLKAIGYAVTAHRFPAACLAHKNTTKGGCLESLAAQVPNLCKDEKPNVVALWAGLNDVKVTMGEGPTIKDDLLTLLISISRWCGSPSIVLIKPPLFFKWKTSTETGWGAIYGDAEWPKARIPHMRQVLDKAFTLKQNRTFRIVNAQPFCKPEDFDLTGHFCIHNPDCLTNLALSSEIVKAVRDVTLTPVIPGLHMPAVTNLSSNTSTWLSVMAATSVPMLILEAVIGGFPTETSVGGDILPHSSQGRPWLPLIDLARLLGVLHIVVFHLYQFTSIAWFGFGKYWLSFFFFASGFSCSYSASSQLLGPLSNAMRCLRRVYPAHVLGVVIFLIAQWNDVLETPLYDLITTLTLTQAILPPFHNLLNGPAWFLSTLVVFWLLSPHWLAFLDKLTRSQCLILLVFCWVSTLVPPFVCFAIFDLNLDVGGDFPQFVEFHFTQRWMVYLGGMVLERVTRGQESSNVSNMLLVLLLLLGVSAIACVSPPGFTMGHHYLVFDHGFVTFPLFCAFTRLSLALPSTKALQKTKWLGSVSLPIFLLHIPVRALVELAGGGTVMFMCLLVSIVAGQCAVDQFSQ